MAQFVSPKRLLQLLKSEKNTQSALALFDSATRQPSYTHSPAVFHHILRRLIVSDSRLFSHVTRIVDLIKTQKCECPEDVALTVIKGYTKNSMPHKAVDVFQNMVDIFGCSPGIRSYNSMLNAFVESNQWDKAEEFFNYIDHVGLSPNMQTYNILIKVSCRKKQFDKEKKLLDWSWDTGLSPSVHSYGTLINGLVKSGDLVGAREVFDEMFERGAAPNAMCYNILIDGCFKKRDYVMAKEVFDELVQSPSVIPDVGTYNVMINGLCKCRRC